MIARIFKPVIWLLNWLANSVLRLFRVEPKDEATSTYTLDEVAGIVEQSTREGLIDDTTGALAAAFEFTTKKVSDVEVPIAEVVALAADATPNDLQRAVVAAGHSRYGIHDAAGEPTGYLHLKDVMDLTGTNAANQTIPAKRIRRLPIVYHESDLEDALAAMRRSGSHVARAVDHDGRTTGIVFLEDVIEVLVGEIEDAAEPAADT
jgi:CBS domain containing-hemolysin-like protein